MADQDKDRQDHGEGKPEADAPEPVAAGAASDAPATGKAETSAEAPKNAALSAEPPSDKSEENADEPETKAEEAEAPAGKAEAPAGKAEAPAGKADAEPTSEPPPAPGVAARPEPAVHGAAWAEPLARFERSWTRLETRLLTFVLFALILALIAWVLLTGLAAPPTSGNAAGVVFRAIVGASLLGSAAWAGSRKLPLMARRAATVAAFLLGIGIAPLWRSVGTSYFDNMKAWLQEGSTLTLMGGLRGVGTRLTLWLALLGGSLATSAGKHIHVDLLFRALPRKLRLPASLLNNLAAAAVCFAAVWGFFDHIAIESFGSRADDAPSAKIERVSDQVGHHLFLVRAQLGLDLRSLPRVVSGDRYEWMTPADWNTWLDNAGFRERYPGQDLSKFVIPEGSPTHAPAVISPDGESTRGILVHTLGLVFPFGMLMIGLRFLLRLLLTLSGHIPVDPDEAHREDLHRAGNASSADADAAGGEHATGRA